MTKGWDVADLKEVIQSISRLAYGEVNSL